MKWSNNPIKWQGAAKNEFPCCWSLLISLVLAGFIMMVAPLMEASAKVSLIFEPGVPDKVNVTITRGIKEAERFYKDSFGITLPKDLEIVVVPDKAAYANALQRMCKKNEEQAVKEAARSGGTTCSGGIVIPVSKNMDRMFFVAIHELTHKYQGAVSPGNRERDIMWLMEGGATATAGYIADRCGVETLQELWNEYLDKIRSKQVPPLRDLRTFKGHNAAREKYPGDVVYPKESLAALELARRKGGNSLYHYFLNLKKDNDSAKVFEMTFGTKLDAFERDFETELEWTLRTLEPSYRTERLGRVWREKEDKGWEGLYTRRGNSSLFDAIWTRKESEKVKGVLIVHLSGNKAFIESRQQSNGRELDYEGTISEDSRTISGTFWPPGSTGPILRWEATIER